VLFAKFETLPKKIFSSIAHNEESSKNYFAAKRAPSKQRASKFEKHSIAIIAKERTWT